MRKNKGFTLVELLAVIVVLAIILAIAIPSVLNIISNTRYSSFKSNEELFIKATKTYLINNVNLLPLEGFSTKIYLSELETNSYIEEIKDPLNNNNCNADRSYVLVTYAEENKYTYKPFLICDNYISLNAFNLVPNGDFSNGSTGWAIMYGSSTVNNNELTYTVVTLNNSARIQQNIVAPIPGNKYYVYGFIYPKFNNNVYFNFGSKSSNHTYPNPNSWNKISHVITATDNANAFRFYHPTATNYVVGDTIKFKNIIVLDLTTIYGEGVVKSAEEMDNIISNMQ